MARTPTSKPRRPKLKPLSALSPSTRKRLESFARRSGVSVEEVRASQELTQAARGHRVKPGQRGESAERIRKETIKAERGEWTSYRRRIAKAWVEKQEADWDEWRESIEAMGWERWVAMRDYLREQHREWKADGKRFPWSGMTHEGWSQRIETMFGLENWMPYYHSLY